MIVASVEDTIHHAPLLPLSSPSTPSSSSATSSYFSTSAPWSSSYTSSSSSSSSSTANTREELQNNRLHKNISNSRDATVVCNVYDNGEVEGREGVGGGREVEGEGGSITAIIHAGADLLLRTAYCPDKFSHRVVLLK